KKFILSIIPENSKKCPTYEQKLTQKINLTESNLKLCNILHRLEFKLIDNQFNLVMLEYCTSDLSMLLLHHMNQLKNKTRLKLIEFNFVNDFDRILFQLIFTLAIIKDDYIGFIHGDFFMRNILLNEEKNYKFYDYVAYHYKQ